jgi:zinc/manganese transport system substrate-binding protein
MNKLKFLLIIFIVSIFNTANAKLSVLTTTTNLESIVSIIGGDKVDVLSLSRGTQDPHFLEAKPSYMLKASKADLLVSIGLELEIGWLPLVIRGARNPKLMNGNLGNLVIGDSVETLEKPIGELTRADGDVHPEGNPHILLDPLNGIKAAELIKNRLIQLDKKNTLLYESNFNKFSLVIEKKMLVWKKHIPKNLKVITYHKTLTYYYDRFNIINVDILEPKPGIPPTAKHVIGLMKKIRNDKIKLIIVENYFDPTVANKIAKDIASIVVKIVPVAVRGTEKIKTIIDLYDELANTVVVQ